MESNISRDHIAMEAMKVILQESAIDTTPFWKRCLKWVGINVKVTGFCGCKEVAKNAYEYADAMIAERERTKNKE